MLERKKVMSVIRESWEQAEINARARDEAFQVDLSVVEEQEKIANELGYGLYKLKEKNRANFTQTINENWNMIVQSNYLTSSELAFVISIHSLVEFSVNAIADPETGRFMTVSEIARRLNRQRTGVSRIIQSLIKKGILFEFVNADEVKEFNRNVSERTLFMNPELFYSGDRNKIDGALAMLVAQNDKLEKNNILLNWKVWRKPGEVFGRLYHRKTYLKYKRGKYD